MQRGGIRLGLAVLMALGVGAPALGRGPLVVDQQGRQIRGKLEAWVLRSKVPLPSGLIQIRRLPCPFNAALAGCVYTRRPRIVYMRPGLHEPRRILYHELGHVFDLAVLNRRERVRFKRIVGIRRAGWFAGALPPAEWFGDGYALCATRLRLHGRRPKRPKNPPPVVEVAPPPPDQTGHGGCTLVDQLLTGCTPPPPPPPAPSPPVPVTAG